jgi:hypothetical protein
MSVNDKLDQWKADFTTNDTNDPGDETTIGTTLGAEFRSIKSIVRKDLSRSQDLSTSSSISQSTPADGTGKAYTSYKSVTPAELNAESNIDWDMLATGLSSTYTEKTAASTYKAETYNESLADSSFQVLGNWGEVFFPGTPFAVSADGFKKFAGLNLLSATENTTPPSAYTNYGTSTKFTFHPQLVPFPRNDEVSYVSTEYALEIDGANRKLWLKVTKVAGDWSLRFKTANLKGRRIQVIKMTKAVVGGNSNQRSTNYPGDNSNSNIVERYPDGSVTYIMNGETKQSSNSNERYYGLYYYQKDIAVDIDGVDSAEAESFFGSKLAFSWLEAEYIPSEGAGAYTGSIPTTAYVMRISNENFLRDPQSSTTISSPDSAYYLAGSQNGNRELNGDLHDSVCFQIVIENIGENETKTFNFISSDIPYPISFLSGSASNAGNDWRASIECVSVQNAPTDFVLTPDIARPIITMNEWEDDDGTTGWEAIKVNNRTWHSFTLKFTKAFTAKITYEIKIVSPILNGKTLSKGV